MQVQPALAQSSPIDPQHLLVQHESHFPNQRLSSFQSTPASTLHGFPMQQSSLALYPLSAQQNDLALSHVTYAQASSSTTSSARHLSHSGNLAAMPATLDQQLFLAPVSEKRGAVRSINAYSNSVSQPPTLFNRPAQPSGTVIKEGRVRLRPSQKHQGVWPRVMATLDSACILRLEGRGVTRLSVWNKGTSSNVPPRRPSISDMYWSNHAELAPTEALAAPESGSSLEANEEPSHLNTSKRRMEPISPVSPRFPLALSTGLTALAPARETPSPDPIDLRGRPDRPSKAVRRSSSAGLLDSGRSHGRFDSKELRRGISVNPRRTLRKSDQSAELPISDRTQAKETNPPGLRSSSRATMSPTPYRSISTPTLQLGKYSESAFSMTFRVLAIQESTALNALRRPTRCLKVTVIPIGDDEEFAGKADESLPTSHIFIRHRLRAKMDAWKKLIKDALNSREIEIPVDDADDGSVEELDKPLQVVEESRVEDASPSPDQGMGHGNEHVAEQNGSFSRRSQISSTSSALSRRRRMSSIHRPRLVPQKVRSLAAVPSEEESIDSSSEARLKSEANEVVKVHAKLRKYQQKEAEWKRQIADLKRRLEENEEQHRKNQTELFDELQDAADENTKNADWKAFSVS
ncbi:hypothetical protein DFJ73DRAFT_563635 [Zopfochytrium polystomum]|nr:hypothetical protein DFJ73DRAFT_563635 [Zopfochytrium polystomum]